jgi:hypothetical protein
MSRIRDRAEAVATVLLQIARESRDEAGARVQFVTLLRDEFCDVARELINEGFRCEPEEQPVVFPAQSKLRRIK